MPENSPFFTKPAREAAFPPLNLMDGNPPAFSDPHTHTNNSRFFIFSIV